ncbi:Uncharacterised protein [Raoultella terrigena]|uniref:Uncharacterized protein n=1 Tax=Raoultella terrigena TaxID=577 RepID=A0A4U9D815_RAOTE|nr:Uncharacterised protein [Raoultella terrigena]
MVELAESSKQLIIMGKIFTETESWVEQQFIFCDPSPFAAHNMLCEKARHIGEDVFVLRRSLHGFRLPLHMHQTHRQTGLCPPLPARRAPVSERISLMICAPTRAASRITSGFDVSTEIHTSKR